MLYAMPSTRYATIAEPPRMMASHPYESGCGVRGHAAFAFTGSVDKLQSHLDPVGIRLVEDELVCLRDRLVQDLPLVAGEVGLERVDGAKGWE